MIICDVYDTSRAQRDSEADLDEERLINRSAPPESNSDFLVIKLIGRIVISVVKQCWALSGAMFITICVFYWIFGGISAFILLCFSAAGIFYRAGDKMLYYPEIPQNSRIFVQAPNTINLPFENLYIKSLDSTKLHAYFLPQPQPLQCPTILFFHGNAGNIGHRLPNIKGLYKNLKANLLIVEYRGYGLSEGNPSESGLYKDAQAALNYLFTRQDVDHTRIFVFGRSLGGSVAIDLASRACNIDKIACLIVENSFTSIPDMAFQILPWKGLKYIPLWLNKNKFLSKKKVTSVRCPTIFVSGLSDQLVPPTMMLDLYTHCGSERKLLLQIPNGDHNGTWTKPGYYAQLERSIQDVCSDRLLHQEQIMTLLSVQTV
uniref:Protein ABHD13 n=1 Tax=Scapholeberis mucronata TaxID=202097 RepID=A0A4Y7NMD5_9CRUS|nr:EOG090X09ZU [Scapholeberis mucronata]SVE93756.1 EOG090X09ZU [Scapholeberis mucronata]